MTSYASLSEVERRAYDADLQAYRDVVNQIDFARQEGMEKGMEKGIEVEKENTVRALGRINMALNQIAEVTGLTIDKIKSILSR